MTSGGAVLAGWSYHLYRSENEHALSLMDSIVHFNTLYRTSSTTEAEFFGIHEILSFVFLRYVIWIT